MNGCCFLSNSFPESTNMVLDCWCSGLHQLLFMCWTNLALVAVAQLLSHVWLFVTPWAAAHQLGNKYYAVVENNSFYTLLDLLLLFLFIYFCWYFVEDSYIYVHDRDWCKIFFSCSVFFVWVFRWCSFFFFFFFRTSLVAQMEKNKRIHSSVQYLGKEDPWRRGRLTLQYSFASLVAQIVKYLPAMREIWVWSLTWEGRREWQSAWVF